MTKSTANEKTTKPDRAQRRRHAPRGHLADWLSVPQVADRLGLCTATVYAMIRRKELPAVWVGRKHLRVRPEDLDAWEAAGGVRPQTGSPKAEKEE
jgi:excisionase family DNA binding protein